MRKTGFMDACKPFHGPLTTPMSAYCSGSSQCFATVFLSSGPPTPIPSGSSYKFVMHPPEAFMLGKISVPPGLRQKPLMVLDIVIASAAGAVGKPDKETHLLYGEIPLQVLAVRSEDEMNALIDKRFEDWEKENGERDMTEEEEEKVFREEEGGMHLGELVEKGGSVSVVIENRGDEEVKVLFAIRGEMEGPKP